MRGAGFWQVLQDISTARRQCTPQSAPCGALPVCGTRIIRRMLKHACILRPLHLLRLAFSAAGGARLLSPLQGSRSKRQLPIKPPLQGEVPPQAAEGCGAWPCHYPSGPPQPLRRAKPCRGLEDVRRLALPLSFRAAAAQKQPRTVFWVRGCFAGMRAGRLGVSGRRIPGWLSPKQRLPVWRAGHRRRRHAATADAAPPEFVPPPRCRPPAA